MEHNRMYKSMVYFFILKSTPVRKISLPVINSITDMLSGNFNTMISKIGPRLNLFYAPVLQPFFIKYLLYLTLILRLL
jgi:hypothetical protein